MEEMMALIYVVEDDKNISEIESFALKNAGHQIVECACAKEFHKQVQERIPDMVPVSYTHLHIRWKIWNRIIL